MKKIVFIMLACITAGSYVHAQNVFPATGRTGIYTTTPAASLQVKGGARIGTLTNYINIDSATGNLSFLGTANYLVQNNQFAFRAATASNIGLYFNQTNSRIEFRNSGGTSVFNVGVGPSGNNVGIGTSTPAAKLDVNGDALINGVWVGRGNNSVVGNVALGSSLTLTVGDANTAIGTDALDGTTTGVNNTAVGYQSLLLNSTGSQNTGLGLYTLYPNTTGNNNTAIGVRAMDNNATGSGNTAVGISSLTTNTSGNNNTALGYLANVTQGDITNATAIGANAKVSASNSLVLGDNANVGIGTSAPAAKLDIAGNIKIADGTQGAGKVLTSDANGLASWTAPAVSPWTVSGNDISNSNSGNVGIGIANPDSKLYVNAGSVRGVRIISNAGTAALSIASTGSLSIDSTNTPGGRFLVSDNGNVGIGTNAPTAKLDVKGTANISGGVFSSKIAVASSLTDLTNNAPWYGIGYSNLILPYQTNPATQVGGYWGINFVDRGGNMVFSNGNLGIGTNAPGAKLEVRNDINGAATSWLTNKNSGSNAFSILQLVTDQTATGVIFKNSSTRSTDGGVNTMTVRNDGGDLRLQGSNGTGIFVRGSDGNVGIGINVPGAKLHVLGDAIIYNTQITTDGMEVNQTKTGDRYALVDLHGDDTWADYSARFMRAPGANSATYLDHRGTGSFYIFSHEAGPITFLTSSAERMKIDGNGNVGIGTSAPAAKLEVSNGDIGFSGDFRRGISKNYNVNNGDCFGMENVSTGQTGSVAMLRLYTSSVNSAAIGFGKYTSPTSFTEFARFDNNGNLAIGTSTPSTGYKLTVAGKVICTELKVQLQPFPDYVFAKDYKLLSLNEVQNHINTYHRLPGMPAAAEIEKNGMEVGKMQGKVVEKVEENMLYILQLNKENESLKTELVSQQQQLDAQAKAIAELKAMIDALKSK